MTFVFEINAFLCASVPDPICTQIYAAFAVSLGF